MPGKGQRITEVQRATYQLAALRRWQDPVYQEKQSAMRKRAWRRPGYRKQMTTLCPLAVKKWRKENPKKFSEAQIKSASCGGSHE